jgi:hypothetical protein
VPDTEILQDASYNVVLPDGTSGEYTIRYDFKNDKIATTFLMQNGIKNEYTPSGSGGSLISIPVKDLTRDGEYSDAIISFSIIRVGKTVGPPLTVFDFLKCTAGISYYINQKLTNNKEKELSLSYSVYVPESKKVTENISFSNKQAWVLHSNESLATHFTGHPESTINLSFLSSKAQWRYSCLAKKQKVGNEILVTLCFSLQVGQSNYAPSSILSNNANNLFVKLLVDNTEIDSIYFIKNSNNFNQFSLRFGQHLWPKLAYKLPDSLAVDEIIFEFNAGPFGGMQKVKAHVEG